MSSLLFSALHSWLQLFSPLVMPSPLFFIFSGSSERFSFQFLSAPPFHAAHLNSALLSSAALLRSGRLNSSHLIPFQLISTDSAILNSLQLRSAHLLAPLFSPVLLFRCFSIRFLSFLFLYLLFFLLFLSSSLFSSSPFLFVSRLQTTQTFLVSIKARQTNKPKKQATCNSLRLRLVRSETLKGNGTMLTTKWHNTCTVRFSAMFTDPLARNQALGTLTQGKFRWCAWNEFLPDDLANRTAHMKPVRPTEKRRWKSSSDCCTLSWSLFPLLRTFCLPGELSLQLFCLWLHTPDWDVQQAATSAVRAHHRSTCKITRPPALSVGLGFVPLLPRGIRFFGRLTVGVVLLWSYVHLGDSVEMNGQEGPIPPRLDVNYCFNFWQATGPWADQRMEAKKSPLLQLPIHCLCAGWRSKFVWGLPCSHGSDCRFLRDEC